jgi:hypothetical protein
MPGRHQAGCLLQVLDVAGQAQRMAQLPAVPQQQPDLDLVGLRPG